jgi:protein-S-isoprenylcysteine O-methyltransferase Ste14
MPMRAVELVFAAGWAAFLVIWLLAALFKKRGRRQWSREGPIRVLLVALFLVLARLGVFRGHRSVTTADPWREAVGLVLFALGLGFAIWARVHIGRNWGVPMTQKNEPELVTSGPYRFVRHPIYSGVIAAGIGTAVGLGWFWLVPVALYGTYFVYAARVEERFLTREFPDSYPQYTRATKMLVPFVF